MNKKKSKSKRAAAVPQSEGVRLFKEFEKLKAEQERLVSALKTSQAIGQRAQDNADKIIREQVGISAELADNLTLVNTKLGQVKTQLVPLVYVSAGTEPNPGQVAPPRLI